MIMNDAFGGQLLRVGDPGQGVHLLFSTPTRPYGDDPAIDMPARAKGAWVDVEELIQTLDGDGLVEFFSSLADESSSWSEARTWLSSERQLRIVAEQSGGRITLRWGMHRSVSGGEAMWSFETVTSHKGTQEMKGLSEEFQALLAGSSGRNA